MIVRLGEEGGGIERILQQLGDGIIDQAITRALPFPFLTQLRALLSSFNQENPLLQLRASRVHSQFSNYQL